MVVEGLDKSVLNHEVVLTSKELDEFRLAYLEYSGKLIRDYDILVEAKRTYDALSIICQDLTHESKIRLTKKEVRKTAKKIGLISFLRAYRNL